ncbi:hypothetical protein T492DRAFT_989221 [Pavlovales sp. CCMP2436]|nr:hypothetical protein T492DRAFT_989221 [Pavlovales sp. CCMP2436]
MAEPIEGLPTQRLPLQTKMAELLASELLARRHQSCLQAAPVSTCGDGSTDGDAAAGSWLVAAVAPSLSPLPLANTNSSERATGETRTQRNDGAVAGLARCDELDGSSVGAAGPSSGEWDLVVASTNEARLIRGAVSNGVSSTPLDMGTEVQAAASEQGQPGGAWPTPELERSRSAPPPISTVSTPPKPANEEDDGGHACDAEPLLPRADDGDMQERGGQSSGMQAQTSGEGKRGQKRQRLSCDKPGCAYTCSGAELLRGHKRSKHSAEMLCCEHPGCEFKTAWLSSLGGHRKIHRIVPQASPPAALQAVARVEPHLSAEHANAEEAAAPAVQPMREMAADTMLEAAPMAQPQLAPAAQPVVKEERTAPLRVDLAAAETGVEEARRGEANAGEAGEAAVPAAQPAVKEESTVPLRADLVVAETGVEEAKRGMAAAIAEKVEAVRRSAAQVAAETHGRELRAAHDEATALKAQLNAALDEQRKAALSSLIVRDGADSLRAELAAAKAAAAEAERGMAKTVAELVAVRKSIDATAEVQGRELRELRELRAAVAKAEGKTAAAVAEEEEAMRRSVDAIAQAAAGVTALLAADARYRAALARAADEVAEVRSAVEVASARADVAEARFEAALARAAADAAEARSTAAQARAAALQAR